MNSETKIKSENEGNRPIIINQSGSGMHYSGSGMMNSSANSGGGSAIKRRKQDPKTGKGLRHFSMKVCEKVRQKGTTTYNEVADELVAEFSADPIASRAALSGGYVPADAEPFDQKNIRRRVYDALNVLMAMNIISKEKKEIKWIGLPTNAAQECVELNEHKTRLEERIKSKRAHLHDILLQHIALKNLVDRNRRTDPGNLQGTNPGGLTTKSSTIALPFIVVYTDKKTVIDCSISPDKTEYLFNFDAPFQIHDDADILKTMGFAHGLEKRSHNQQTGGQGLGASEMQSTPGPDRGRLEVARGSLPEALREEFDLLVSGQTGTLTAQAAAALRKLAKKK